MPRPGGAAVSGGVRSRRACRIKPFICRLPTIGPIRAASAWRSAVVALVSPSRATTLAVVESAGAGWAATGGLAGRSGASRSKPSR
jgi:hypothetical protein